MSTLASGSRVCTVVGIHASQIQSKSRTFGFRCGTVEALQSWYVNADVAEFMPV